MYGEIKFGFRDRPAIYYVIVDEGSGVSPRLFVDANGSGDFSGVSATDWVADPTFNDQDGKHYTNYSGSILLQFSYGATTAKLGLSAYRFDKKDPRRAEFKNTFFYYADYIRTGQVTLGGKNYAGILADTKSTGDFRPDGTTNKPATVLYLDVNGDGKFSRQGETFRAGAPFNLAERLM